MTTKPFARRITSLAGLLFLLVGCAPSLSRPSALSTAAPSPVPLYAYFYIWFDSSSWERGKTDLPQLGGYSSDDADVMRQQVRLAKQAGLTGFLVSWKDTPTLDARLESLIRVAGKEGFKLAIVYEGLDFYRNPLPAGEVASGLDTFLTRYSSDPVFDGFGKPLVIWSGTWRFSAGDIAAVGSPRRDRLLLLASEKNVAGYRRLSGLVDGDAYYWSSVNPDTMAGYSAKLSEMGKVVRADGGLWIAPAAPGFDARGVGGVSVVERKNGDTLTHELGAALASAPDALGLISWNEYSENSQIEPSRNYGSRALEVLSNFTSAPAPYVSDFDSSAPGESGVGGLAESAWLALGFLSSLVVVSLGVVIWRQVRRAGKRNQGTERQ